MANENWMKSQIQNLDAVSGANPYGLGNAYGQIQDKIRGIAQAPMFGGSFNESEANDLISGLIGAAGKNAAAYQDQMQKINDWQKSKQALLDKVSGSIPTGLGNAYETVNNNIRNLAGGATNTAGNQFQGFNINDVIKQLSGGSAPTPQTQFNAQAADTTVNPLLAAAGQNASDYYNQQRNITNWQKDKQNLLDTTSQKYRGGLGNAYGQIQDKLRGTAQGAMANAGNQFQNADLGAIAARLMNANSPAAGSVMGPGAQMLTQQAPQMASRQQSQQPNLAQLFQQHGQDFIQAARQRGIAAPKDAATRQQMFQSYLRSRGVL